MPGSPCGTGSSSSSRISISTIGSTWPADDRRRRIERVVGADRGAVVVGAEHGDRRRRLGEAVGVDEAGVGEQAQRVEQHPLGDLGAAVARASAASARRPARRASASTMRDSIVGTTIALVMPSLRTVSIHTRRVERTQVHEAAAGERVRQHVGHAGDVVRRHRHQHRLVLAGAAELDRAEQVGHQVAVAQQRRLRLGRGAAGVEHDRDLVVVERRVDRGRIGGQRVRATRRAPAPGCRPATRGAVCSSASTSAPGWRATSALSWWSSRR